MDNENEKTAVNKEYDAGSRRYKQMLIAIFVCAFIAIIFGVWLVRDFFVPKHVTVRITTMEDTFIIDQDVASHSVGNALEKLGITLSDIDSVFPYTNTILQENAVIDITKRLETRCTVAGKEQNMVMIPGTVEENLAFNNITYDDDDIIKPKLSKKVKASTNIEVKDVEYKTKKKKIEVDYKDKIILDPTVTSGVMVEDKGVTGVALYTYTYKYVNGEKVETKKKFKKWLTEPHDHVIRLGTSVTGESGEVSIRRTFTSNTTAYYVGEKGIGSTGGRCHYGTVAVDPSVFPYGSRFWIAGYGFGYANDCGGAIKGTKLDLYMRSNKEVSRWGRRWVTAYLLG